MRSFLDDDRLNDWPPVYTKSKTVEELVAETNNAHKAYLRLAGFLLDTWSTPPDNAISTHNRSTPPVPLGKKYNSLGAQIVTLATLTERTDLPDGEILYRITLENVREDCPGTPHITYNTHISNSPLEDVRPPSEYSSPEDPALLERVGHMARCGEFLTEILRGLATMPVQQPSPVNA